MTDNIKEINIQKMLEDKSIIDFLRSNGLSLNVIRDNYLIFLNYLKSKEICNGCKDIKECKQHMLGRSLKLVCLNPEKIVINELKKCDFMLKKDEQESYQQYFVYNDISKQNRNIFFEDAFKTCQDKVLCAELAKILSHKEKKGIYLFGDFGVGKTYICASLMNSLARKKENVAFVKVGSFVDKMRSLTINDKDAYDELLKNISRVTYLVLDDIGTEGITSFSRDDVLFNILDYRMENQLTTFFTSNADIEKLRKIYQFDKYNNEDNTRANRLIERIDKLSYQHCLKGENLR